MHIVFVSWRFPEKLLPTQNNKSLFFHAIVLPRLFLVENDFLENRRNTKYMYTYFIKHSCRSTGMNDFIACISFCYLLCGQVGFSGIFVAHFSYFGLIQPSPSTQQLFPTFPKAISESFLICSTDGAISIQWPKQSNTTLICIPWIDVCSVHPLHIHPHTKKSYK